MGEESKPAKQVEAQIVLECGHADSFEHRLLSGIQAIETIARKLGQDPMEPCMSYIRDALEYCYINVPTLAEIQQIEQAHKHESTEVN